MLATPELLQEAAQPQRLAELLPRCLEHVPLYRRLQLPSSRTDPASALDQLRQLPLITKHDIRLNFPHNFLGNSVSLDDLIDQDAVELEHTSGTSEERTPLLLPRGWWAEQERRALRLNPVVADLLDRNPAARRVTINSPVCSGDICYTGNPSRDDRIVDGALFVSLSRQPFLWSEPELARIARETVEWQPHFLDVDPVYGVVFARYCERHGIRLPTLRFIICSYEYVSVVHRRILQRVFGVPVLDLYGSTETGHLLMEDDQGRMRPSLETAFLDLAHTDAQGVAELIVTTLTNPYMPLLHYRIGDLVERQIQPYGTRYVVHGRTADAFATSSGRRVTTRQVDQCLADLPGFAHYQLSRHDGAAARFRFIPDCVAPAPSALETLRDRLTGLLGTPVVVQTADLILPEASGKFRLGYPESHAQPV
jgi:phenylacetate-CoA ligase